MQNYFIRWTPNGLPHTKETMKLLCPNAYVIAEELSKRQKKHFHIVMDSPLSKSELKDFFYTKLQPEHKGPRSLQIDIITHDIDKTITYTIKDGDYIYSKNYSDAHMQTLYDDSYQKTLTYADSRRELVSYYLEDDRPKYKNLYVELLILRSKFSLEIYPHKLDAYILSLQISTDHNVANQIANKSKLFS